MSANAYVAARAWMASASAHTMAEEMAAAAAAPEGVPSFSRRPRLLLGVRRRKILVCGGHFVYGMPFRHISIINWGEFVYVLPNRPIREQHWKHRLRCLPCRILPRQHGAGKLRCLWRRLLDRWSHFWRHILHHVHGGLL